MSFSAWIERKGSTTLVGLKGDLDMATEAEAREVLAEAGHDGALLVLDLRELDFLDSTGVRLILAADEQAKERGQRFGVVRGGGMVARLLHVTRVQQRFPVVDDPSELSESAPD